MSSKKKKVINEDDDNNNLEEVNNDVNIDSIMVLVSEGASLVSGGASARALQMLLNNPPVTLKENAPKEAYAEVVVKALVALKDAEMVKACNDMSDAHGDNALKYVYWGLSTGKDCASLLKWHGLLVEKLGNGSILRVLTEKKVADNKVLA